jgi:hypothetical protein
MGKLTAGDLEATTAAVKMQRKLGLVRTHAEADSVRSEA